ncbi:hypothetical protein N752_13775 [Desulforamulus aquiferis]|nr:class I SAM-dependent methyltransferase [Desulforamulus aquiferis]RYD04438.1 hypothetical protein N752_13775 [Desulforamulus aquiferis]
MINWYSAAKLGHYFLNEVIKPGDITLDGTMGNGHDTAMLARAVGPEGKVYAFDIQERALDNTRLRLAAEELMDGRVRLIQDGHQNISQYITDSVKGAIFNLGYLPGGDHSIITLEENTLAAIKQALKLLLPGGRMVIVVYPGHPGGAQERQAVEKLLENSDSREYKIIKVNFHNRPPSAPGFY